MILKRFLPILLCISIYMPGFAQNGSGNSFNSQKAHYLWPNEASPYLSSTFAETRSSHFHSALDLKTWGQKGYKVFATRDGIVHRIAIGPRGYGKVIYLKHNDGSYSVYAHLLKFEENIQHIADSIRFRNYSFELDRVIEHLNIHVKQGEVIGLSGASGIGPPHLHFELRTPSHKPFNPLLTNLDIADHISPQFSSLAVEPLSVYSSVEGKNQIYTKRALNRNGNYSFGTIDVKGPVGLATDVFDQADGVSNAYAVYELKMYLDGNLMYHSKADSFSYSNTHQMFADRVYPLLEKTGNGYQRLYIKEGNTLPFYKNTGHAGNLDLEPGTYNVKIEAMDYYGNSSHASLTLKVQSNDSLSYRSLLTDTMSEHKIQFEPNRWDWFPEWVNILREVASGITIATTEPVFLKDSGGKISLDLGKQKNFFFRADYQNHFNVRRVHPDSLSFLRSTTGRSFARFRPGTFYEQTYAGLYTQVLKSDSLKISVVPSSQPIQKEYTLAIALDSLQQQFSKFSIYRYDERKEKLSYLESRQKNGYLWATPEKTGTFFALRDTVSPVVEKPKVIRREDGQSLIYIKATDNLSGINHQTAVCTVNGVQGIVEYEPENNRLIYYHPEYKPSGKEKIIISVKDMEGNRTTERFIIPE